MIVFEEIFLILGLMCVILLLFRSRVVRCFKCGKFLSFIILLLDKLMFVYWFWNYNEIISLYFDN